MVSVKKSLSTALLLLSVNGLTSQSLAADSQSNWKERCLSKALAEPTKNNSFASKQQMFQEVEFMTNFGPRHTGSEAHNQFLDYTECWMQRIGLVDIARDSVTIKRHNTMSRGGPTSGTTEHLYGFLPGESKKTIILGVHSDGQNSIQENGVPVIMEIAAYLARQEKRKYTYAVVFPTGHMAKINGGMEAISWSRMHRNVIKDTLIAVAPEHLGTSRRTGPVPYFITATGKIKAKAKRLIREMNIPAMNVYSLGIGSGLAWRYGARIPVLAGISTPTFLFNVEKKMEVINPQRLHKQSTLFLELVKYMETLEPRDF